MKKMKIINTARLTATTSPTRSARFSAELPMVSDESAYLYANKQPDRWAENSAVQRLSSSNIRGRQEFSQRRVVRAPRLLHAAYPFESPIVKKRDAVPHSECGLNVVGHHHGGYIELGL